MLVAASNFLVPNGTFLAEVLAFLVVLAVLAKWVVPPLEKAMNQRQAEIRAGIEAGEEGRRLLEGARAEAESLLENARQTARVTLTQATRLGEQMKDDLRRQGQEAFDRMVLQAATEIERSRRRAEAEMQAEAARLAVTMTEALIGRFLDEDLHQRLLEASIDEVAGLAAGGSEADK
jgi:F-type H+-transporting ATPase subunit b